MADDAKQRSTNPPRCPSLDGLLDGALIAIGALAVVDSVLVHWALGWHRLIEGWQHNLPAEVLLVVTGAAMFAVGSGRARRRTRSLR